MAINKPIMSPSDIVSHPQQFELHVGVGGETTGCGGGCGG